MLSGFPILRVMTSCATFLLFVTVAILAVLLGATLCRRTFCSSTSAYFRCHHRVRFFKLGVFPHLCFFVESNDACAIVYEVLLKDFYEILCRSDLPNFFSVPSLNMDSLNVRCTFIDEW